MAAARKAPLNITIDNILREKRTILTEIEAKQVMTDIGLNVIKTKLAKNRTQAATISAEIGFPVVLKVASPDIIHKTDAGGVKVGLKNKTEVIRAYGEIMATARAKFPRASIRGVAVQKMAGAGTEIIIGMSKDPQFGPVIMFGLGGIFVEVLKDVSFRIIPVAPRDATAMIREIKGLALLKGYRGHEPADLTALEDVLLKVSSFIDKTPEIKELDLNPVFAYPDGAVVADARIVLEDSLLTG